MSIVRDWPVFLVSVGTLILLVATAHYARKQWLEANRNAGAAETAAKAAKASVQVASDTLQHTKEREAKQAVIDQTERDNAKKSAQDSAKLARSFLQATVDNFQLGQRAWLGFKDVSLESEMKSTDRTTDGSPNGTPDTRIFVLVTTNMKLTLVNTGSTPARITSFEEGCIKHEYWGGRDTFPLADIDAVLGQGFCRQYSIYFAPGVIIPPAQDRVYRPPSFSVPAFGTLNSPGYFVYAVRIRFGHLE